MRRFNAVLLAAVAPLALYGCGDGSSGGGSMPASGTPTPSPTPSPTPTPTPSPTPTPTGSYDLVSDFDRDRSFDAIGVRVVTQTAADSRITILDSRIDPESAAIGFDFNAATRTYRARYGRDMLTVATERRTLSGTDVTYDVYGDDTVQFLRTRPERGVGYVGWVGWSENTPPHPADPAGRRTDHYLVYGPRTVPADVPQTGVASYSGETSTYWSDSVFFSPERAATITVDYAAGTISISTYIQALSTGTAGSGGPPELPVTMNGRLERTTGRIRGAVTLGSGAPSGEFEGELYGPGGIELGLVFKAADQGLVDFGFLIARR